MKKTLLYASAGIVLALGLGIFTTWNRSSDSPSPVPPAQKPVAETQDSELLPPAIITNERIMVTHNTDPDRDGDDPSDLWLTNNLIPNSDVDVKTLTTTAKLEEAFPGFYIYYMPKIYIEQFPTDFAQKGTPNLFVKALMPIILHENNMIKKDRAFLETLTTKAPASWSGEETARFEELVQTYGAIKKMKDAQLKELLQRVDIIPPSLAMAVAGVHTNWGKTFLTAPFGQKEWMDGRYVLKPFNTLSEAVHAFMLDLNTQPIHQHFRLNRSVYKNLRGSLGERLTTEMGPYNPDVIQYPQILKQAFKNMSLSILDQAVLYE